MNLFMDIDVCTYFFYWVVPFMQVINLTPYEAVLQWSAPELSSQQQEEISVSELLYEVFLNNSLHKSIAATQLTISGLKPATEYRV